MNLLTQVAEKIQWEFDKSQKWDVQILDFESNDSKSPLEMFLLAR